MIIEKSSSNNVDFNYRIINANGTEVEQCGNGARCLGYYLYIKKKIFKKKICLQTKNRYLYLERLQKNIIKVNMGIPLFHPSDIPFVSNIFKNFYTVKLSVGFVKFSIVSMGNPHCLIYVTDIKKYPINIVGLELSKHALFPQGVNVNFMQIISRNKVFLRVFERHVGETQACGSGACGSVALGIIHNMLDNKVLVNLPGGELNILWKGIGYNLYMSGSATYVYDGTLYY